MDEKKEIVIVSDENDIIVFDDIIVKRDTINRAEVAEVEKALASLVQQRTDLDNQIIEFKAKLIYARKIIAIADEKRNSEISSNNANVTNESRVGSSFSNMQTQRREV